MIYDIVVGECDYKNPLYVIMWNTQISPEVGDISTKPEAPPCDWPNSPPRVRFVYHNVSILFLSFLLDSNHLLR